MASVKYWIDLGDSPSILFDTVSQGGLVITNSDEDGRSTFSFYTQEVFATGPQPVLKLIGNITPNGGGYSGVFDRAEINLGDTTSISFTNGNWSWDDVYTAYLETIQNPRYSSDTIVLWDLLMAGDDLILGSQYRDDILAFGGDDVIIPGLGDNYIYTGNGADVVYDGPGEDNVVDSDADIDKVILNGRLSDFTFTFNDENFTRVQDANGLISISGSSSGVERFIANDYAVATDVRFGQNAGMGYRLYKAAFDRAADFGGLGYWIDQLDDGASLQLVASGFIHSAEFQSLYGANPSDTVFLTKLYNNVLDRDPDQGGLNYWIGQLNDGMSRESALINFSESNENVSNVAALIGNGIQYQPWLL